MNTRDDLSTICLARFLLPSYLFFKNNKFNKNSKILVIGYGCIGYATVLCLLKFGFKNIVCFYRNNIENVRLKNIEYIDKLENLNNFNLIIDCTGEIKLIRHILINSLYFSKIILLGTPREMGSNELLLVHRKNLVVYGAHEIFGYTNIQRQKSFNQCLKIIRNLKLNYSKIVGFTYTLDKIPLTKYVILKRS
ncbi:MAG: hypothetical protein LBD88_05190 [Candidatus Peribacteria bacterium]|nr:hypothetical protein [Candidatus Peribacteria bacterium]